MENYRDTGLVRFPGAWRFGYDSLTIQRDIDKISQEHSEWVETACCGQDADYSEMEERVRAMERYILVQEVLVILDRGLSRNLLDQCLTSVRGLELAMIPNEVIGLFDD
jgi:hypothetical protein